MGFPGAGLLVSSCQYTMVPLRGISAPRANGHPYVNGQPYTNGAHLNGICPSAGVYASTKPRDYSPDEVPPVCPCLQLKVGLRRAGGHDCSERASPEMASTLCSAEGARLAS